MNASAAPWELAFAHAAMAAAYSAADDAAFQKHCQAARNIGSGLEGDTLKSFTTAFKTLPVPAD